jgi:hypothetical protein
MRAIWSFAIALAIRDSLPAHHVDPRRGDRTRILDRIATQAATDVSLCQVSLID